MFLRARHLEQGSHDSKIEHHMIGAQRAACKQAAKTLNLNIVREYVEYGGTGSIDKRPELRLMLDELRAIQDVRYMIVSSPDRLTRSTADWATIRLELEAAGVELIEGYAKLGDESCDHVPDL
jgi:DNA invertase Pin-like site-specific DNA recombinase